MAGFPSRHAAAPGLRHRLRRPRRPSSDRRGLAHERLEQRTPLAADCFDAFTPCIGPTESWPLQDDIVVMPCIVAPVEGPVPTGSHDLPLPTSSNCPPETIAEIPPGYAPPDDRDGSASMGPAAIAEPADVWQMMAAMSAESDLKSGLQAEEEARRMDEMQREMSLFYLNVPALDSRNETLGADHTTLLPAETLCTEVSNANALTTDALPDLASIPATVVPPPSMAFGPVSGWLASNAEAAQQVGGLGGALGHMANGTAAGFVSLFDVVAPRVALDVYATAFCGSGFGSIDDDTSVATREAAAFARYIYDHRFDDDESSAGGLLKAIGVQYAPQEDMQAALFKGRSGIFYLAGRGTEILSADDWKTNIANQFYGRSMAHDLFIDLLTVTAQRIESLGGRVIGTGHSLAGGMAIAGSHATGVDAIVFNPAYVSESYLGAHPGSIEINLIRGEPLDFVRRILGAPAQGELHYYPPLPSQGMKHGMGHFPSER
jgi:hypothetical protein